MNATQIAQKISREVRKKGHGVWGSALGGRKIEISPCSIDTVVWRWALEVNGKLVEVFDTVQEAADKAVFVYGMKSARFTRRDMPSDIEDEMKGRVR